MYFLNIFILLEEEDEDYESGHLLIEDQGEGRYTNN